MITEEVYQTLKQQYEAIGNILQQYERNNQTQSTEVVNAEEQHLDDMLTEANKGPAVPMTEEEMDAAIKGMTEANEGIKTVSAQMRENPGDFNQAEVSGLQERTEELTDAIDKAVEDGQITEEEAKQISEPLEAAQENLEHVNLNASAKEQETELEELTPAERLAKLNEELTNGVSEERRAQIEKELEELESIEDEKSNVETEEQEIARLEEELATLEEEQEMDDLPEVAEARNKRIQEINDRLNELRPPVVEATAEEPTVSPEEEIASLEAELADLEDEAQIDNVPESVAARNARIEEINNRLNELRAPEKADESSSLSPEEEIANLEAELANLEDEAQIDNVPESVAARNARIEEINNRLNELRSMVNAAPTAITPDQPSTEPTQPVQDGNVLDSNSTTTYEYEFNEEATKQDYKNSGYSTNADGWYFNPSTDDYEEGYDPLQDPLFQMYDKYEVVTTVIKSVDKEATMQQYRNDGFGQNADGWYFNPSTDDYEEGYDPLQDPLFQVIKEDTKVDRNKIGTVRASEIDKANVVEPNAKTENGPTPDAPTAPTGQTPPGGNENNQPAPPSGETPEPQPEPQPAPAAQPAPSAEPHDYTTERPMPNFTDTGRVNPSLVNDFIRKTVIKKHRQGSKLWVATVAPVVLAGTALAGLPIAGAVAVGAIAGVAGPGLDYLKFMIKENLVSGRLEQIADKTGTTVVYDKKNGTVDFAVKGQDGQFVAIKDPAELIELAKGKGMEEEEFRKFFATKTGGKKNIMTGDVKGGLSVESIASTKLGDRLYKMFGGIPMDNPTRSDKYIKYTREKGMNKIESNIKHLQELKEKKSEYNFSDAQVQLIDEAINEQVEMTQRKGYRNNQKFWSQGLGSKLRGTVNNIKTRLMPSSRTQAQDNEPLGIEGPVQEPTQEPTAEERAAAETEALNETQEAMASEVNEIINEEQAAAGTEEGTADAEPEVDPLESEIDLTQDPNAPEISVSDEQAKFEADVATFKNFYEQNSDLANEQMSNLIEQNLMTEEQVQAIYDAAGIERPRTR